MEHCCLRLLGAASAQHGRRQSRAPRPGTLGWSTPPPALLPRVPGMSICPAWAPCTLPSPCSPIPQRARGPCPAFVPSPALWLHCGPSAPPPGRCLDVPPGVPHPLRLRFQPPEAPQQPYNGTPLPAPAGEGRTDPASRPRPRTQCRTCSGVASHFTCFSFGASSFPGLSLPARPGFPPALQPPTPTPRSGWAPLPEARVLTTVPGLR